MVLVYPLRVRRATLINYTYLVVHRSSREALLIDPGAEPDVILEQIARSHCQVKGILLTHHHQDHTALASFFAHCFQVPVYMSRIEQEFHGFTCDGLQLFTPGQALNIGELAIFPWHTPGHTKGGVCYQVTDHLFTGDTLFPEGCGMCFGLGSDPVDMYNSLQQLRRHIDPAVRIYPGHSYGTDPGVSFGYILKNNIYFHLKEITAFVAFRMRKHQRGLFNFK